MKLIIRCTIVFAIALGLAACSSTSPDTYAQAKLNFAEQNYYDAYQQLLVPAAKGNPDAEYALGYLYYYGKGTARNTILGKQWILKAARDGNEQAAEAYQMILSREQGIMPISEPMHKSTYHPKILRKKHRAIQAHHAVSKRPIYNKRHKVQTTRLTTAEKLLLACNPAHYTLQLFAAATAKQANQFMRQYKLGHKGSYFKRHLNGHNFYAVVYGDYASEASAQRAIRTLPAAIKSLRPWPRRMASVQAEIKAASKG